MRQFRFIGYDGSAYDTPEEMVEANTKYRSDHEKFLVNFYAQKHYPDDRINKINEPREKIFQ